MPSWLQRGLPIHKTLRSVGSFRIQDLPSTSTTTTTTNRADRTIWHRERETSRSIDADRRRRYLSLRNSIQFTSARAKSQVCCSLALEYVWRRCRRQFGNQRVHFERDQFEPTTGSESTVVESHERKWKRASERPTNGRKNYFIIKRVSWGWRSKVRS